MSVQTQKNVGTEDAAGPADVLSALDRIFAETVALFQRLRAVAPLMHTHADLERDECTVLQGLDRDGARTITDIGNDCGIPRNQAQKLVKALEKADLVELREDPDGGRAKLVDLTDGGRQLVRELDAREVELLTSLPLSSGAGDLEGAAEALADVRRALNDEGWRKLLNNGSGS